MSYDANKDTVQNREYFKFGFKVKILQQGQETCDKMQIKNIEKGKVYKDWVHAGLRCKVIGSPIGNFNGYVAVPKGHVAFGKDYDSLPIDVHGGLTFGQQGQKEKDGWWGDSDLWWFGFDTAHAGDRVQSDYSREGHWWTLEEVISETERMAEQFAKLTLRQIIIQRLRWQPDWVLKNITIKRKLSACMNISKHYSQPKSPYATN